MMRWIRTAAVSVFLMLAVIPLAGCQKRQYERIEIDYDEFQERGSSGGRTSAAADEAGIQIDGSSAEGGGTDQNEDGKTAGNAAADGEPAERSELALLFGGDILLSDHVLSAYQKAGGIGGVLDKEYRQVIQKADFFMANEEFPFSTRGTAAEDKQYTFRIPPEKVSLFKDMGIDAVTLANNHALDYGADALLDSVETLDGAGILHTGAGENLEQAQKPVIYEQNGIRVGILGATRVMPDSGWAAGSHHPGMLATYDPGILLGAIKELRETCDYVVVFVHWGVEKEDMPQEYQRTLGQQYLDAGADLVIGSHPHVLQGVEYYKGKPIVYSLGNFVFGSSIPRTALLRVSLKKDSQTGIGASLQLLPGTSGAGYTRMFPEGEKRQEFFRYMEQISFGVSYDEQGMAVPK